MTFLNVYTNHTEIIDVTVHYKKFKLKHFLNFGSKEDVGQISRALGIVTLNCKCSKCSKR